MRMIKDWFNSLIAVAFQICVILIALQIAKNMGLIH